MPFTVECAIASSAPQPRQGRQNVAHGASRGVTRAALSPLPPSPGLRGRGNKRGWGPFFPGLRPGLGYSAPNGAGTTYIANHRDRRLVWRPVNSLVIGSESICCRAGACPGLATPRGGPTSKRILGTPHQQAGLNGFVRVRQ